MANHDKRTNISSWVYSAIALPSRSQARLRGGGTQSVGGKLADVPIVRGRKLPLTQPNMMMREWRCSPSRTTDASPRGAAETVSQYRNGPITEYREQYIADDVYKVSERRRHSGNDDG